MTEGERVAMPGLGPLEAQVLESLWRMGRPATVGCVRPAFPGLAYTTLMTTLDRLHRKGFVKRVKRGRAFVYEPRASREQLLGEKLSDEVMALLSASGSSTAILTTLVHCVGRSDAALLDELESLVQAERSRLDLEPK